jgi:23S rRNA (uracil1939-C5)-methyltransferase
VPGTSLEAQNQLLEVEPKCRYFGICGGCSFQNHSHETQLIQKQQLLENTLLQKVKVDEFLPALSGIPWNYRYRARLSARFVEKKGGSLVGFREKRKTFVTDMESCHILPERVSKLIGPFRELIGWLSIPKAIPQIDVVLGDFLDGFVIRHLQPFTDVDLATLKIFEKQREIRFFLQPGGPGTLHPLDPENSLDLEYALEEFDLTLKFHPAEFTQVNPEVNRLMVGEAVRLLNPCPGERIADLFCGIGNFSLPLARRGAFVVGMESNPVQVRYAIRNAELNGLQALTYFAQQNLEKFSEEDGKDFDKMVLDPPRSGAEQVVSSFKEGGPQRIIYVSCNSETLARDADILVNQKGYILKSCRLVDMFPQTSHMESLSLFTRQ